VEHWDISVGLREVPEGMKRQVTDGSKGSFTVLWDVSWYFPGGRRPTGMSGMGHVQCH